MAISGSLKDVAVTDVLQFIHLGRRSGTLVLARDDERAVLAFHRGRLVSAQSPGSPKLGDLLISSGLLDRPRLLQAVQAQLRDPRRPSLGQILLSTGAVSAADLRQVMERRIEQAVSEVVAWEHGTFDFALDDLSAVDELALIPGDVLPDADLNTQMVLLEAARIFDEKDTRPAADEGGGASPAAAMEAALLTVEDWKAGLGLELHGALPPVHVVTSDAAFVERLAAALPPAVPEVRAVELRAAGVSFPGTPPPIVIVDLRERGIGLGEVAQLHRAQPAAALVAISGPGVSYSRVHASGVLAVLPPEVEAVVACIENIAASHRQPGDSTWPVPEARPAGGDAEEERGEPVARLRRVFGELRSGLISATVALNLMHLISESFERAVLLLVKLDHLAVLGAFGVDERSGRPLAELLRGVKLPLGQGDAINRAVATGEVQRLDFDAAALPAPFRDRLGPPRASQIVVFPVLGAQRVIAAVYADNGERAERPRNIEILELAAAQVGIAFENELLRRQIAARRE
jgi:hypothetical protein